MSGTTTNLGLFKYNPNTDGDQTFNIDNALNNNWDSLDTLIGALTSLTTTQKASLVGAINELVTNLGGKAAKDLGNLDSTGQGILDAKIEAEALAAQNGYIKFKLNGISNIIIQWGFNSSNAYATLPIAYTTNYIVVSQCASNMGYNRINISSLSTFESWGNVASTWMWIAIGY